MASAVSTPTGFRVEKPCQSARLQPGPDCISLLAGGAMAGAGTNPGSVWYLWVNDEAFGPIDIPQLRTLRDKGLLQSDHWVRRVGDEGWIRAAGVEGVFDTEPPGAAAVPTERASAQPPPLENVISSDKTDNAAPPDHRPGNYVARHWRGELSLPVSYWINGFLGNVGALVVIMLLGQGLDFKQEFRPAIALLVVTAIWATVLVVAIWQYVGVWRSATNYANKNVRSYWGGVAKFMVCIAALRVGIQIFTAGIPQITEFAKIYAGNDDVGTYKFQVLNGGQELEFTGGIAFGAAKAFEGFADASNGLKTVRLTSIGGRISEAQRIADQVKRRGLNTYVPDYCVSACTIIFLGGRQRFIDSGTRLGFHQPDFPGITDEERKQMIADEERRLTSMGVSPAFAKKANLASPKNMWYPNVGELLAEHIATRVLDVGNSAVAYAPFVSPDGSFSVDFGGVPKLKKELGIPLKTLSYDSYIWSVESRTAYKAVSMFVYSKVPSFDYDAAVAGAAESTKARVVSQKRITQGDLDGRDVVLEAPNAMGMRMRLFFVRGRFYQILFVGKSGETSAPGVDEFLASFRIKP